MILVNFVPWTICQLSRQMTLKISYFTCLFQYIHSSQGNMLSIYVSSFLPFVVHMFCLLLLETEKIDQSISIFLSACNELYPESFFTINLHLLSHLSSFLHRFGPTFLLNMFAFEMGMKSFKSLFLVLALKRNKLLKAFYK